MKMLEASCIAGIVKVGAMPVVGVTILSEGIGPSEGILLIAKGETFYVAKTSPNLESALTSVIAALTEISTTLTAIGAGMLGPLTAPPPTLATSVATITLKVAELTVLKGLLK